MFWQSYLTACAAIFRCMPDLVEGFVCHSKTDAIKYLPNFIFTSAFEKVAFVNAMIRVD